WSSDVCSSDLPRRLSRGVEESPDTAGQDAPDREAAKADGKWHRKQTAGRGSPESRPVRVKRWGKSPPAALATEPARQTPSGARGTSSADAAPPGAGELDRWMVTLDRIRLTGLLQKSPAMRGFSIGNGRTTVAPRGSPLPS